MNTPPMSPEERRLAASLHHKKALGEPLTEAEEVQVARFYAEVEGEEAERLRPARERQERYLAELEARNRDVEALLQRETAFSERLQTLLKEISEEREAIQREKQRILANPGSA